MATPILFDSHTHIQFPAYDEDRKEVIDRAKIAGVKMITVGTQYETSKAGVILAEQYPDDIWATVGFHPAHSIPVYGTSPNHKVVGGWHHDTQEQKSAEPEKFDIKKLEELAKNPKVVAIGECGLDYYRLATSDLSLATSVKEAQKQVFVEQIKIAQKLNKPLMIHARPSKGTDDAYLDALHLLQPTTYNLPPIFHFYAGSLAMTKTLVDFGAYFTFGGVMTFVRDYDEIIKYIPLERILLETDAPYVAPLPYRGARNEPAYVVETAKKLAELKGISFEETCQITTNNVRIVFGIE